MKQQKGKTLQDCTLSSGKYCNLPGAGQGYFVFRPLYGLGLSQFGPTQLPGVVCPFAVLAQKGHGISVLNVLVELVSQELVAPVI